MARDARLRLAQDLGEVGDRQLGLGEQRQDAQPRVFARGLERLLSSLNGDTGSASVGPIPDQWAPYQLSIGHKDIFIRLSKRQSASGLMRDRVRGGRRQLVAYPV